APRTAPPRPRRPPRAPAPASARWSAARPAPPAGQRRPEPAGRAGWSGEEILELHRGADVAADLELAGHVRRERVLLAVADALEGLLGRRDRAIASVVALVDHELSVVDLHRPRARSVDREDVGRVDAFDPAPVGALGQRLEEFLRALAHDARLSHD